MAEWIACGDGYIEADVIRWKEPVWERRRGKARKIGDRLVTAEVLREADEKEFVRLLVRGCDVISETPQHLQATLLLKKDAEIRRKRQTLTRTKPERLLWSDESARGIAASKFLGNRDPLSPPSKT
ncbi:MAG: hypothetical protein ACT4QA_05560 [Panacagrimonas sp.]